MASQTNTVPAAGSTFEDIMKSRLIAFVTAGGTVRSAAMACSLTDEWEKEIAKALVSSDISVARRARDWLVEVKQGIGVTLCRALIELREKNPLEWFRLVNESRIYEMLLAPLPVVAKEEQDIVSLVYSAVRGCPRCTELLRDLLPRPLYEMQP